MSLVSLLAVSLLLAPNPAAATAAPRHACKDFLIPINVTVPYYDINLSIETNWDLADYIFNSTRRDSFQVFHPIGGSHTVSTTYTIGATFCTPAKPQNTSETVLLLTHGSMTDRRQVHTAPVNLPCPPEGAFHRYLQLSLTMWQPTVAIGILSLPAPTATILSSTP